MDCSSWAETKKIITCTFCNNLFKKPHTLICCHTYCELCIKHGDFKKCPLCHNNLTSNKLIPFKAICFENLYISRLTTIFRNKEDIVKGTCSLCKTDSHVCSNCYFVGCRACSRNQPCTDISTRHNFCQVDLNEMPDNLLQCTLKQVCITHSNSENATCKKCLKNHNDDSVQSIKEKLLKYLAALEQHSDIQQELYQKITNLEQHKELLHMQYKNEYSLVEKSFDHKIHSICQEKQIVLSKLMTFWLIIDRTVENYKIEIQNLQKLTDEFYTYFVLLIEKSSDKEIITYFIREKKRYLVDSIVEIVKEAVRMIQRETGSFLQEKHILQKLKEQKEVIKRKSFVCTDLSAIPHSRAGRVFKQEYQCLNYEDKLFKIDQIKVDILGEEHSMFALPLAASKVVDTTKQQFMVVSKCAQCLSQLLLFSRALGRKYPDLRQKEIAKSLHIYLLGSNEELLSVTSDAVTRIKKAITFLQIKDVSLYCEELKKSLTRLATFIKNSNDYYTELEVFYFEQQKLHINHDQSAVGQSSVVYISMLLDIMMDCRTYISNTRQICEKLFSIEKIIEILCKEGHEKESHVIYLGHANSNDSFKKLIASHGFQLQIVLHYSTWVALNEICKSTEELITCWNLDRV